MAVIVLGVPENGAVARDSSELHLQRAPVQPAPQLQAGVTTIYIKRDFLWWSVQIINSGAEEKNLCFNTVPKRSYSVL